MLAQSTLPDLETLKSQAKRLRRSLELEGNFVSHSEALELVAHQYGHRDWNTLHAAAGNRPHEPFTLGRMITGRYLGQTFTAEIIGLVKRNDGARYQVTLDLEAPIDVVTFDSFSAFRKRVTGTVSREGISDAFTSNGQPQLALDV